MPNDSNPFNCQSYSSPEVYVDRDGSIGEIAKGLSKTSNDNPQNFLLLGERAMGKSSTLQYIDQRLIESEESKYRFITVLVKLKNDTERKILIEDISKGVRRRIAEINFFESSRGFLSSLIGYLSEIQILGSGMKFNSDKLSCGSISELAELVSANSSKAKLKNKEFKSGILIMIDEADNGPDDLNLGEFLKILIESIRDNNCHNTCFVVSGLPTLESKLDESHGSVLRLFSKIKLTNLDKETTFKLLKNGIRNANRKRHRNDVTKTITMEDSIMNEIFRVSKGHPYLIQKLASSMYDFAQSDTIRLSDLLHSREYKKLNSRV